MGSLDCARSDSGPKLSVVFSLFVGPPPSLPCFPSGGEGRESPRGKEEGEKKTSQHYPESQPHVDATVIPGVGSGSARALFLPPSFHTPSLPHPAWERNWELSQDRKPKRLGYSCACPPSLPLYNTPGVTAAATITITSAVGPPYIAALFSHSPLGGPARRVSRSSNDRRRW